MKYFMLSLIGSLGCLALQSDLEAVITSINNKQRALPRWLVVLTNQ